MEIQQIQEFFANVFCFLLPSQISSYDLHLMEFSDIKQNIKGYKRGRLLRGKEYQTW